MIKYLITLTGCAFITAGYASSLTADLEKLNTAPSLPSTSLSSHYSSLFVLQAYAPSMTAALSSSSSSGSGSGGFSVSVTGGLFPKNLALALSSSCSSSLVSKWCKLAGSTSTTAFESCAKGLPSNSHLLITTYDVNNYTASPTPASAYYSTPHSFNSTSKSYCIQLDPGASSLKFTSTSSFTLT